VIKLSDYVIDFLVQRGIPDIFLVSGGGIMHLLDAVGRQQGLRYWCNYHEQACAIAAEGYARVHGMGACLVTVGPGAVNALSGVTGSWYDSIPIIVISGQVRTDLIADYTRVRQTGPQEGNVVAMAQPITKYAKSVRDPQTIRMELEKAFYLARSGRPGPVWLELPLDIQGTMIDATQLEGFIPPREEDGLHGAALAAAVRGVAESIKGSRRPLMIVGNGVHLSGAEVLLREFMERVELPVALPDAAKDLIAEDHPQNAGVFGTAGQRRANFAVQNSDYILSIGAGLCCKKVGFNYKGFGTRAKKVVVDIDHGQLHHQLLKGDVTIQADAGEFLAELFKQLDGFKSGAPWLEACAQWRKRYPLIVAEYFAETGYVNSYVFMDKLANALQGADVLVGGNGLDTVSYIQAFKVKPGQRTFTSINWGAMGWDLPLTVGACIAHGRRRTICVTGDGSIQLNIQELLTIKQHRLPIKLFIFNNAGYTSIRGTQDAFFEGRYVGADPGSGVENPDFEKLAAAYDLPYCRIGKNAELEEGLRHALAGEGPMVCEVAIDPKQGVTPKASAFRRLDGTFESRPLEDMFPFLPREEVYQNMHLFDEHTDSGTAQG